MGREGTDWGKKERTGRNEGKKMEGVKMVRKEEFARVI
jgi:uncharacterized protein YheU (UPF0270 family)